MCTLSQTGRNKIGNRHVTRAPSLTLCNRTCCGHQGPTTPGWPALFSPVSLLAFCSAASFTSSAFILLNVGLRVRLQRSWRGLSQPNLLFWPCFAAIRFIKHQSSPLTKFHTFWGITALPTCLYVCVAFSVIIFIPLFLSRLFTGIFFSISSFGSSLLSSFPL